MSLPFSTDEFFDVFRRYNMAVWPAQIVLLVAGVTAIPMAATRRGWRAATLIVAALWAWMAAAYHGAFFATVTPGGFVFAIAFLIEAAFLAAFALDSKVELTPPSLTQWSVAALLFAYALILYPLIGYAAGEQYPAIPTFGTPCPTTIFTFGVLVLLSSSAPSWLLTIPMLWAFVGTFAALRLGVPQDAGLMVAALAALACRPSATPLQRRTV